MIPAWREMLAGLPFLLAAAGELPIVDFGDQAGLPCWMRAGLQRWRALFDAAPCGDPEPVLRAVAAQSAALACCEPMCGCARSAS
jgi:S-adenosylmethionine-diacylgycerolhomoserine-N-methlytransferase